MGIIKMQISRCHRPGLQGTQNLMPGRGLCGDSRGWSTSHQEPVEVGTNLSSILQGPSVPPS